jgi:hypothetical protein
MHILLINNNPVVSRLLSFCFQKETIVLEEIEDIDACKRDTYHIMFVDEALYDEKVQRLKETMTIQKTVIFTHTDVDSSDFDLAIQKPFLPSQILEVVESLNDRTDVLDEENPAETQVLDSNEVKKIKDLLEVNDNVNDEVLSEEEYEARKIKAIKEQLIEEGLEIVEEKEIMEEFEVGKISDDKFSNVWKLSEEENQFLDKVKRKKNKSKKKINKQLAHKDDDLIVKAVEIAIRTLTKKQRKKLLKGKEIEIVIKLKGND